MTNFMNTNEWVDYDTAAFRLGVSLGILPPGGFQVTHKWVVASANPTGDMLYEMIKKLIEIRYLQENVEEMLVCINPCWEIPE